MTWESEEDGSDPLDFAYYDASTPDPKSVAEAGFEAGLSVVIEAVPSPSVVVDRACRVIASNRLARDLVRNLRLQNTRAEIKIVLSDAARAKETLSVHIPLGREGCDTFLVAPLLHDETPEKARFLVTLAQSHVPSRASDAGETPLLRYELAPVPVRALREEAARFKRLSEIDPLTGALNVRAFTALVTQALSEEPRRRACLVFIDLNEFKVINDRFGHAAGDAVLTHVARKLTFPLQTGIAIARMGGDEFALWMPGVAQENCARVIEGLRARLRVPVDLSECSGTPTRVVITAAIGAVCCPDEALNYQTMRLVADKRMYEDKAQRPGRAACQDRSAAFKRKGAVDPAPQSFLPR